LPLASYRRRLPARYWHAARIVATAHADCSTCLRIAVAQAQSVGLPAPLLRAILERADLPEDVRDIVDFTRQVMTRDPAEAELRQKIRDKYGERGLIDLAYAIAEPGFSVLQAGFRSRREL
jgi:alkylhydroperoxidase family enzyme